MASAGGGAPAIGIDLGTTNSCVAVWKHDRIVIIPNDQGNRTTPSFVAFTSAERLVGDVAKDQIAKNPANTVFNAKRLIGRRFSEVMVQEDIKLLPYRVIKGPNDMPKVAVTHKCQERQFSPQEISSMVLTKMKDVAEAYTGQSIKNAVITVPAYFNDRQRQATKDAATITGLHVLRMVNEPTAAAIAYGIDNMLGLTGKRNVIIFDLGGGTFDVSFLTVDEAGKFETKGEVMAVVMERNTPIPAKKAKNFVTSEDDQSSVRMTVYQGQRSKSTDNYLLGSFKVSGIPPAPKGVAVIEDCFEIDDNGILTVTAKVVSTGKTEKLTVTNLSGRLSKQEIEKMMEDAEKFKLEDQEYKRKAEAYNALDDCIYEIKKKIKRNDVSPKDLKFKSMQDGIDHAMKWLSKSKGAGVYEIEREKKKLEEWSRYSGLHSPD